MWNVQAKEISTLSFSWGFEICARKSGFVLVWLFSLAHECVFSFEKTLDFCERNDVMKSEIEILRANWRRNVQNCGGMPYTMLERRLKRRWKVSFYKWNPDGANWNWEIWNEEKCAFHFFTFFTFLKVILNGFLGLPINWGEPWFYNFIRTWTFLNFALSKLMSTFVGLQGF